MNTQSTATRAAAAQPACMHTPGPWRVGFGDGSGANDNDGYCITAGDGPSADVRHVKTVVRSGVDDWGIIMGIDSEANARLIAAAPLMYSELRGCMSTLNGLLSKADLPTEWAPAIRAEANTVERLLSSI